MGRGSAPIRASPPRGRVRVPDVKCFEGQEWQSGGGREGAGREGREGGASSGLLPPGPSLGLVALTSQLGTLGRLRGLPHICPLLHGVLQSLGLLLIHLDIVYLLV